MTEQQRCRGFFFAQGNDNIIVFLVVVVFSQMIWGVLKTKTPKTPKLENKDPPPPIFFGEWPDIITYSWAPKRQNLNANVIRMDKNKGEKALICLEGIDKTRFADFPKCHLMFWTTGFSWGVLYLQLQPKNRKFYEVFALSFCVRKLGTNRLFNFRVKHVPDTKWNAIFK